MKKAQCIKREIKLCVIGLCCLVFLHSCTPKKPTSQINDWKTIKSWSFKGKMAINDGENNGSGRVKWNVTKQSTQAQFKAPLGQGSWTIIETNDEAKLISSKNGESRAENAQSLISFELGWHFPWNSLQFWLRGHQFEEIIAVKNQEQPSFNDQGWEITYRQWIQTPLGLLPKKIKAKKPPYSVNLIIYAWEFE